MNIKRTLKKIFNRKSIFPEKKALIIEGGGMRGVFLTGVLQAFYDRGYFPWKMIAGSSAGALTGTLYASEQIHLARDAFFSTLLTGDFIHLENIFNPGKHIMDLDWMMDAVLMQDENLDMKKLKKSCPVYITATLCREDSLPRPVFFNSHKDDIMTVLKATAALPVLYRGFVHYNDQKYLDGGLFEPVPYMKALELGFKEEEILVILTRPEGYRKKKESFWGTKMVELYYNDSRYYYFVKSLEGRYKRYNEILDDLENKYRGIDVINPPDDFKVERLTRDEKKILEGFSQGVEASKKYLYRRE
jgi:predicted patatin/cPLA2 family phospholipase